MPRIPPVVCVCNVTAVVCVRAAALAPSAASGTPGQRSPNGERGRAWQGTLWGLDSRAAGGMCPRSAETRVREHGKSHGCVSWGAMWVGPAGGAGSVRAREVDELALTSLPVRARAPGPRFVADAKQEQQPRCVLKFSLRVQLSVLALCVQTKQNDVACRLHCHVRLLHDAAKSWVCCNVTLT